MNKITIGRYIPKESFIHSLNPLIKLLSIILLVGVSSVLKSFLPLAILFSVLAIVIIISKIKLIDCYYAIRPFLFLLILTFIIQLLFSSAGDMSTDIDRSILMNSTFITLQFLFIILVTAVFTLTTSQIDIARSIFCLTVPLKIFKVDRREIAISIIIAIRFIPLLFDLADRILTAQRLRGIISTDKKFSIKNIKLIFNVDSFLIPLFMKVINYAEKISITLNYKKNIENTLALSKVKYQDIIAIIISLGVVIGVKSI